MSDNKEETPGNLLVVPKEESFLDNSIPLKKLLKDISKASREAVEVLLKCLESDDERIRFQAATKLLEFQVSVAKEINNDQMQRLIAEIKLVRSPSQKLVPVDEDEEKKKNRPVVDFSTIRTLE